MSGQVLLLSEPTCVVDLQPTNTECRKSTAELNVLPTDSSYKLLAIFLFSVQSSSDCQTENVKTY